MSTHHQTHHPHDKKNIHHPPQSGTEKTPPEAQPGETAESLQAQIATLQAQLKEEQLRTAANTQNLNRRHTEEVQAAHKFAAANFAKEMLPVKDCLEMALKDQSGNFNALKTGVEMTLKQLATAFENARINEINPIGEMFDPNLHQAMSAETASSVAPNTVITVMQKGYALNERILRPALVVVAAS